MYLRGADFRIEEEIKLPSSIMCMHALHDWIRSNRHLALSKKSCAAFASSNVTLLCPSIGLQSGISDR